MHITNGADIGLKRHYHLMFAYLDLRVISASARKGTDTKSTQYRSFSRSSYRLAMAKFSSCINNGNFKQPAYDRGILISTGLLSKVSLSLARMKFLAKLQKHRKPYENMNAID